MVPTSPLFQMWIKTNRCLVSMDDSLFGDVLSAKYKSRFKKEFVHTMVQWQKRGSHALH